LGGFVDDTQYFWLLNMTGPELEKWWQEREEFWWPVTPETLEMDALLAPIFGEPEAPPRALRPPMQLPGKFLPGVADRYGEHDPLSSLWTSLYESGRYYYCHLCCDGDSFLKSPDGCHIYHKGYSGDTISDPT
jgi:hypothetical protein